jgi:hypothetical protein
MKSFCIYRSDKPVVIFELTFFDMFKLMLGRELKDKSLIDVAIRQQFAYDMLNMSAGTK